MNYVASKSLIINLEYPVQSSNVYLSLFLCPFFQPETHESPLLKHVVVLFYSRIKPCNTL